MSNGTLPDNNTANALNDSFSLNSTAINEFGSWVGTIADWSGAYSAISFVVTAIINAANPSKDPNQAIMDALNRDFALLNAAIKAQNFIKKWTDTKTDIAGAESVLDNLPTLVTGLPLQPFEIVNQVEPCTTALRTLGYDITGRLPAWNAVYSDQIYWTDAGLYWLLTFQKGDHGWFSRNIDVGYGTLAPPAPTDDIIFHYRFVLPTYLEAVSIFLVAESY